MRNRHARFLRWVARLAVGGACFQIGGCSLGGVRNFISEFNPCLSVLACDPVTYRFLTSGYTPPGADPDVDPACTYPPFCDGDPFVGIFGGP